MRRPDTWGIVGVLFLAFGLVVNSILDLSAFNVVTYPFSETILNQTIGLDAFALVIVAPWSILAAWLVSRQHRSGPFLIIPSAAFSAYMFMQYIVGPQYVEYQPIILLHLAIFVLSGILLAWAWSRIQVENLPTTSSGKERISSVALLLLAAFVVSRYLPAIQDIWTGGAIPAESVNDPSMYWMIFLLDLGIVVPITVGTSIGLFGGAVWAKKAVYGIIGWYTLVPISVVAMGIMMLMNDDPYASFATVVVLSVAALLFTAFAIWLYRPLFVEPRFDRDDSESVVG